MGDRGSRRRSAGARRRSPRRPTTRVSSRPRPATQPSQPKRRTVSPRDAGRAEQVEADLGLREPVEEDRPDARGRPGRVRPSSSRARAGRSRTAAGGRGRPRRPAVRREPTEEPEPHRERLAVRAPRVASELGHHREGERGVADEDDEQGRRAAAGDRRAPARRTAANAIDRRPAPEPRRVVGGRPRARRRAGAGPRRRGRGASENGSRKCHAGPMIADTSATPTQP